MMGEGDRLWEMRGGVLKSEEEIQSLISSLRAETGLSSLVLRVCILRGLHTPEAIREYLSPRFENIRNPFMINGMKPAVERMIVARNQGESVRIFGDYDVDGTTGAALFSWVFRDLGIRADARQPDRFKDGYGLNVKAVEQAVADGVSLLVTVDCGITSFDAAGRAAELGLDLIVVDHHQLDPVRGLPPALAVINPQRPDCESGLRQICGCGLAFYFSMALRARARELGWFEPGKEPNLKQHLDLVVIATAADMVPLTGDNHILVRYGLEVLRNTKKPGVRALLDVAGLSSRDLSPSHLGFVLGPRINASGRMQSASLALELLSTRDVARAQTLALELEKLNQERATRQNLIWDQVRARVEQGIQEGKYISAVAVADEDWHEGVVGIVASRVTESFRRPAAVISIRDGIGKGSVRSFGGKDVLSALRECAGYLKGFGGHKHAAGFSLEAGRIDEFVEAFDRAVSNLPLEAKGGTLFIEGSCSIEDLDVRSLQELERLGPFGPGNPEPVFAVRASIRNHRIIKGRHLRMDLTPSLRTRGNAVLEAIWFHGAEKQEVLDEVLSEEEKEWAGVPEVNRFRGQITPTLRVRDWRKIGVATQ